MELGKKIYQLRKLSGMTQEQLAEKLNISRQTLSKWENGTGMPDVDLHCEKIDKIYPGTKALDGVSFDLLKGKVNVLIGENGAGKSTLMKMIAGIEQPSSGKMYMGGEEVYFKDTTAAREKGIGIIHQELSLFPNLTVYQNIYMNHEQKKGLFLDDKVHVAGAEKILKRDRKSVV